MSFLPLDLAIALDRLRSQLIRRERKAIEGSAVEAIDIDMREFEPFLGRNLDIGSTPAEIVITVIVVVDPGCIGCCCSGLFLLPARS